MERSIMKRVTGFILTAVMILVLSTPVIAQESRDFRMTIKTNPLSALGGPFWVLIVPVTGEYKALFEIKTTEKTSLQVGASYIGPSLLLNLDELTNEGENISGIKTSGVKLQGMFKYFLSSDLSAPEGFYVGPHASFATAKIKSVDDANDFVTGTKINVNGVIGYQLITSGGFALDIFTGLGFVSRKYTASGDGGVIFDLGGDKSSVNVPLGFSFGIAF
jgi:hypothetical protein